MNEPQAGRPAQEPAPMKPKKRLTSEALFDGGIELLILHAGEEYRLRITKNGKLILTK